MKKIIVGAALVLALCVIPSISPQSQQGLSLSQGAQARVGHPVSATSVAGVHRRAHRRATRHGY